MLSAPAHNQAVWTRSSAVPVDVPLLLAVIGLSLMGLVMVASASVEYAQATHGHWWWLAWRHLQNLIIAWAAALVIYCIPIRWWYATAPLLLGVGLLSLLLVLIPQIGTSAGGARRWLVLGGLTIQPSEITKLLLIVYMARFLSDVKLSGDQTPQWSWLKPLALITLLCALLLGEPDMGSVLLILCTVMSMPFLGGIYLRYCLALGVVFGSLCLTLIVLSPYRWSRVITFMNPWADLTGSGYQLAHALNAINAGGAWGTGLGNGLEKQFYLPAAHTDFIVAVMAEELGLVGVMGLLALVCIVIMRIWRIASWAQACKQPFVMHALYGICLLLAFQSFINIGVNMALLPTKGITLPFVSYGGSSLMACMMLVAWVMRAHTELGTQQNSDSFEQN